MEATIDLPMCVYKDCPHKAIWSFFPGFSICGDHWKGEVPEAQTDAARIQAAEDWHLAVVGHAPDKT